MNEFIARLRKRKLVQWALAYVAAAFALVQVLDVVVQRFGWSDVLERLSILTLVLGFFVALVLAWYHGERGAQKVSGVELMILALLLAVGGGVLWGYVHVPATPGATATRPPNGGNTASLAAVIANVPAKSIAVLPFENLSNDKDNEYFVSGMQGLILTKLADIGELKVIARTSTAKYASHPDDLRTIGRQLGVATVLEGSIQKQGKRVLVNVQLIDTRTDSHIWAEDYTRTLDDVFGVEGEVAGKIAEALKARLSSAETIRLATRLSKDDVANDLFLRAEYQTNLGNTNSDTASWKAAIPLYQQAVAQDPNFALALARLSYAQSELAWFGGGGKDIPQLVADARRNAERALALAPDLPASHVALGYTDYWGRADYDAALQAFATALKLRPNDTAALEAQGFVQRRQGRPDAALVSMQQAFALDPRNSGLAYEIALTYSSDGGRYADAEHWLQRALALDPHNLNARGYLSSVLLYASGDIPSALAAARGGDMRLQLQRVALLTYVRKFGEALALLDTLPDTPDNFTYNNAIGIDLRPKRLRQAELYRLLGDMAGARLLYAQTLPQIREQLAQLQGINQVSAWNNLAVAELGLGHTVQALEALARGQAIVAGSPDQNYGPIFTEINAAAYAEAHRPDLAVPLLAKYLDSLERGAYYSPALLRLDPAWDPIRNDPGFQALLEKYAKYQPGVMPAAATSTSAEPAPTSPGVP